MQCREPYAIIWLELSSDFTIYNDVIYIGNETNPYLAAHSTTKYISDIILHPDTEIVMPEICSGLLYELFPVSVYLPL